MKVYRYSVMINDSWMYDAIIPERYIANLKKQDKVENLIIDFVLTNDDEQHERDSVKVILDDILRVPNMKRKFTRNSRYTFVFGDESDYQHKI